MLLRKNYKLGPRGHTAGGSEAECCSRQYSAKNCVVGHGHRKSKAVPATSVVVCLEARQDNMNSNMLNSKKIKMKNIKKSTRKV
eukprot:11079534-Heterocapsa_arctica.AAC.1